MGIKMTVSKDAIKAPEPIEEDIYTVKVEGFRPTLSRNGDSINFNPLLRVVSGDSTGTKNSGKTLYENLNQKAAWIQNDFVHALGLEMETVDADTLSMPGSWNGDAAKPQTLKYNGPMLGRTAKVKVVKKENPDTKKVYNQIDYYICALPECNKKYPDIKHTTNLAK